MSRYSRRRFLVGSAAAAAAAACSSADEALAPTSTVATTSTTSTTTGPPTGPYPFSLGVASGDPDDTSVVLWTAADRAGDVLVEVSPDDTFASIVFSAPVQLGDALTGRVVADGLDPDTTYWYRFWLDGHRTPPARTRTAPAAGTSPPFTLGHLSCMRYSDGFWTALADVAEQAPDLVIHCGDYIYESDGGSVRPVDSSTPVDLDGYREIWRRYKAEPELQAAHAVAPWLCTWDDHEVENNYQGDDANRSQDGFLDRRAAGYLAWWEFTPTRLPAPVAGEPFVMHRVIDWGDAARFVLLDTRQYRDDQPCPDDLGPRCDASEDVSMLGAEQEAWAAEAYQSSTATWTVSVSGTVVHQWRLLPGNRIWNLDQWDGYPAARRRLLTAMTSAANPIVLSGDVHSSWASDLQLEWQGDSPFVGAEFVAPGISSGVPEQLAQAIEFLKVQNGHIGYGEATRRGWVHHTVDDSLWSADYRLVDDVTTPDGTVTVDRTKTATAGFPGLT